MQTLSRSGSPRGVHWRRAVLLGMALFAFGAHLSAASVGEVSFSRGAGSALSPSGAQRIMGTGLALNEGDSLATSTGATAIIKLQDGTKLTMRSQSRLVFEKFRYTDGAKDNALVIKLTEGGVRVVSGEISKASADAAVIQTNVGTLKMMGGNFDARICGPECQVESGKTGGKPSPTVVSASAKFVSVEGDLFAVPPDGNKRKVFVGSPINKGESLESGSKASGVVVFQDDSRLTIAGGTQIKIDDYRFDAKKPAEGSSAVSLLSGSMRALTGVIAKENVSAVSYNTPTATIGIRGTGLDLDCSSAGTCNFFTWLGAIAVLPKGQTNMPPIFISAGNGLQVTPTRAEPAGPTLLNLTRPDQVPVDLKQLFTVSDSAGKQVGLIVSVQDGTVELASDEKKVYLSAGETGVASPDGEVSRPPTKPLFIEFDKTPQPNSVNPLLQSLFSDVSVRTVETCPQ